MKLKVIPSTKLTNMRKHIVLRKCQQFCYRNGINHNFTLIIDFRKKNEYKTEGLFGGFVDPWNKEKKEVYVNLNVFREYTDPTNLNNAIHCILHELTHLKQIQERRLKLKSVDVLVWNGKLHKRAPFNYDVFTRIFSLDPALAQDYHTSALPWEKEAYALPEKFMKKPLHAYERDVE